MKKVDKSNIILVRFIQNTVILLFTALVGVLLLLVFLKARLFLPASPDIFRNYIIAAFIPCLLVECIFLLLLFTKARTLVNNSKHSSIIRKGYVHWLTLVSFAVCISYFPNPDLAFIHLILGVSLLVTFWSFFNDDLKPLLISWFPLMFSLVLIILNMIPPQGNWGSITHLYGFRSKEPIMGEGGRLVPDLKVHLKGFDSPTPRSFITNSQGFRNSKEFTNPKKEEELRVLNLGDSFSIGYHLDQTEFLGPLLEDKLKSETDNDDVSVLNAAISDPAYGLYYLQQYGLDFHPDVVILGLCGNDFVQSYSFAGPDQRFHLVDSKLEINSEYRKFVNVVEKYDEYIYSTDKPTYTKEKNPDRKPLKYLPLASFIGFQNLSTIRKFKQLLNVPVVNSPRNYEILKHENQVQMIDGFPNIGFYYKDNIIPISEIYNTTFRLLKAFKQACDKRGIQFIILYFPTPFEVVPSEWQRLYSNWQLNADDFDLSKHRDTISKFSDKHNIVFVDTTGELMKNDREGDLFLPLDAHFTELTHKIIADCLSRSITALL